MPYYTPFDNVNLITACKELEASVTRRMEERHDLNFTRTRFHVGACLFG